MSFEACDTRLSSLGVTAREQSHIECHGTRSERPRTVLSNSAIGSGCRIGLSNSAIWFGGFLR